MSRRASRNPDVQIAELQQRIHLHRLGLKLSAEATKQAIRVRLTSPAMLLAAVATGFLLGKLTRSPGRDQPSALGRFWSLVTQAAGGALKFARSGPALWLATNVASRAQQRAPQNRAPQNARSTITPQ
jgi:hypothetical protein